jgi:hypothetical protein
MRASGLLKRELSNNSLTGFNGGPSEKKYARKVSFGSLETVVFNKNHSASNLSGGVSVSAPHFGSTPNARWGNGESPPSANANYTWGSSSSSSNNCAGSTGNDSRWGQSQVTVVPQANKFLSSQMTNAVNILMQQAAFAADPTRHATQPLQQQHQLSSSDMFQAKRPCRAPSPPLHAMNSFVVSPLQNSTGINHFGPLQPRRAPSPTDASCYFVPPPLQRHSSVDSVFALPPPPASVPSPTNFFPEPMRRSPLNTNTILQCPTPYRPGR